MSKVFFSIAGGAGLIQQFLNTGLVDEFHIAVAPVFFGGGRRLFDRVDWRSLQVTIVEALHSPQVTHLRYAVTRA